MSTTPASAGGDQPGYGSYQPGYGGSYQPGYGSDQPGHEPYPAPRPGEVGYAADPPPSSHRTLGWIGVAVLYALVIWQLVVPTVGTFVTSTTSGNPISGGGESVGLENWAAVAGTTLSGIVTMAVVVLPVTLAAAALGLAIGSGMTAHHRLAVPTRILVGVLAALFVPLGVGISRFLAVGLGDTPTAAMLMMVTVVTMSALPLLTAGFATAFGVVLSARSPGRGVGLVLLVGLTGALALGPQLLDLPLTLAYRGPGGTQAPMVMAYMSGFQMLDFGTGTAVSAIVLLVAGLLGIVAMIGVVLLRVRLGVPEEGLSPRAVRSGPVGLIVAIIATVGGLIVVGPFLISSIGVGDIEGLQPMALALRTWGAAALGTFVQVVVAVIGGAAIGWCRPAGRASLWLLLPLAPWLFVGPAPLMISNVTSARDAGTLNSWIALVPGPGVVVAAVVVLALLFAGWQPRPSLRSRAATGAAVIGIAGVLLLTQAQSLMPGYLNVSSPDLATAPVAVLMTVSGYGTRSAAVLGLLYPIPMFLLVAGMGVMAQLGLRRVVALDD